MQLISFKEEQVKDILKLIGVSTDYPVIGNCKTCDKDIKLNNLGMISKGEDKPELYCDNPACCAVKCAEELKLKQKEELKWNIKE